MIRPATIADAKPVTDLIMLAIGEHLTELYTGYTNPKYASSVLMNYYNQAGNRFSKQLIMIDEENGQVRGMILCYDGKEANSLYAPVERQRSYELSCDVEFPIEASEDEYYIDALAVFPQYQGNGIASMLMHEAETHCREKGINKLGLLVDHDKSFAKQVYMNKGFKEVGTKLLDGAPFYHMVKGID